MKSVNVRYFALFRELAGKETESIKVDCATYADLYRELSARYQFILPIDTIQVAVNDEFIHADQPLIDNASVVFIPPVAGG